MKKLIMLGTASSVFDVPYDNKDYDIWGTGTCFGIAHQDIKRIDLGFELHPPEKMVLIKEEKSIDYDRFDCPIMVQDENDPVAKQICKNPKTFPLQEVLDFGGTKFYTSTFCYMIVYAVMLGYKEIGIYKALMCSGSEYFLERPGMEYWIEKLGVKYGVKFYFPEDCELFASQILYGYEQRPNIYKIGSFVKHLWDQLHIEYHFVEHCTANANKSIGALEMYQMLKNVKDEDKIKEILNELKLLMQTNVKAINEHKEKYLQFFGGLQVMNYEESRT